MTSLVFRSHIFKYHGKREERICALQPISRRLSSPVTVGVFNACSVASRGKSQSISTWVDEAEHRLTAASLIETWQDGPDTPSLVACAPPGYVYCERARPIEQQTSYLVRLLTTAVYVCFTATDYTVHAISTELYQSFEHIRAVN